MDRIEVDSDISDFFELIDGIYDLFCYVSKNYLPTSELELPILIFTLISLPSNDDSQIFQRLQLETRAVW